MRACVGQHLSCQSSHMSIIAVEQVLLGMKLEERNGRKR